jgi:hypothetical protein
VRTVRKEHERDPGWHGEAGPCGETALITCPNEANRKANLVAGRARQELTKCHQIGVGRLIDQRRRIWLMSTGELRRS